jgi:hypothetical protein
MCIEIVVQEMRMIPRRSFCLSLFPMYASVLLGQQGHPVPAVKSTPEEKAAAINSPLTKAIEGVMEAVDAIKPGMTRADLLTVFTDEGGLSTRAHRTYVYKLCPYVKVDVDFVPVTNPDDWLKEMSDDKILKMSRPYLQYSVMD